MADEVALRERQLVAQHEARVTHIETEIDGKVERMVESQKRRMDGKERQFRCTVDKLLGADEALESSITCMVCLSIMRNPVTLVPCGHSFCETCAQPGAGTIQCGVWTGCCCDGVRGKRGPRYLVREVFSSCASTHCAAEVSGGSINSRDAGVGLFVF